MDQDFTFPACHPIRLLCVMSLACHPRCYSHITQPQYPDHQDITWSPHDVSCLGLCTKLTWSPRFLSSELFYPCCQEILQSKFIYRSKSHRPQPNLQDAAIRQQDTAPWGGARAPLPGQNVKSQMKPQIVGINNPPVPKTDTQETENLDKAIFSWSRGCTHVLTPAKQTHKHKMADSGSSLYPWQLYLPHTWHLSRWKVHSLSRLVKRLRGFVRVYSWWAMELYRNPEEGRTL
jgi:hypothetical protein